MASQNSYLYGLPYDVRRSQSQAAQFPSMQQNSYSAQFPDAASGRQWAYSQSPTSPISPVSPASIGIHKTYTLAGALSPRPKSRQHPSSSSQSSNAGPAPNSSSVSVSWSTSASYPDPRVQVQAGQQQQSAIHQTTVVSTAYGSSNINLGGMRSNFKQPTVPLLSQPQPPSRVSMNAMRNVNSSTIDEDDLDGDYIVEDFTRPNHCDEPGATSNAAHLPSANVGNSDNSPLDIYPPASSPAPELQYPIGVSGTPTDFLLGFPPASRATHQAAYEIWAENVQMQSQLPSSNATAGQQLPAHMQQQQFRYTTQSSGPGPGDPFVPSSHSQTGNAGAHYSGSGTGARAVRVSKGHDFQSSPASSLASPTVYSGRSAAAQNIIPGLQKGKGKEREHVAMPTFPVVPIDHSEAAKVVSASSFNGKSLHPSLQGTKDANSKEPQYKTVKVDQPSSAPGEPPKKVKMHQCQVCKKLFPRPSGLETHMNSHSGARPFKCPLELCNKTFAVRSNARRHLKTHGITLPGDGDGKDDSGKDEYHVGFEEPVVIDVHEFGDGDYSTNEGDGAGTGGRGQRGRPKQRRELRWVPPSLAGRTNAAKLRSLSPASDMADVDAPDGEDGEDEDDEDPSHPSTKSSTRGRNTRHPSAVDLTFSQRRRPGLQVAPTPLSPVKPTDPAACADLDVKYEERDSYAEMGVYPYHPQQQRSFRH